ncbi:MAG: patatin-like phospholipase family protein [Sphingobacteriaceae bacterium]|nr:patatin-like phospholipase family protein [Sphingobacteriaceae bacterium]
MKALVISGGGSKGAFAGGVAEYLIQEKKNDYDIFVGTSTGSLLIPHLAVGNIEKIKSIYNNTTMERIFSLNPFIIKQKKNITSIKINHLNVIFQFFKGKLTFGESHNLRKYIEKEFSIDEFEELKNSSKDVIITVTNLSDNEVEYKSIKDFDYTDFCDWIWISCNYVPFMSLTKKNGAQYADGGFSNVVPIRKAIQLGATEVDVIILDPETKKKNNLIGKNVFSLMMSLFSTLLTQIEKNDVVIGKLASKNKNVKLNLYYTPSTLTDNPLVFDKEKMQEWWKQGFEYAKQKNELDETT